MKRLFDCEFHFRNSRFCRPWFAEGRFNSRYNYITFSPIKEIRLLSLEIKISCLSFWILLRNNSYPTKSWLPSSKYFGSLFIIYSLRVVHFVSFLIIRKYMYMMWKFTFIWLVEILFCAKEIIFWWSFYVQLNNFRRFQILKNEKTKKQQKLLVMKFKL